MVIVVLGENENSQNRSIEFVVDHWHIIRYSSIRNYVPKTRILWNLLDMFDNVSDGNSVWSFLH